MSTETIQHAYNDVVADHYDLDPQGVTGNSQGPRPFARLQSQFLFGPGGRARCACSISAWAPSLFHCRLQGGSRRRSDHPIRPRSGPEHARERTPQTARPDRRGR